MKDYKYSTEIHPNIFKITLPLMGEKPGPVNAFLFIGKHNTLLDVGSGYTFRRLKRALKEQGIAFKDIEQIILTHGHLDHYGAVGKILKHSNGNTTVALHKDDEDWIVTGLDTTLRTYALFYRSTGLPFVLRTGYRAFDQIFNIVVKPVQADSFLEDGESISLGDYHGKIISTPGHSKGSVCIYLEEDRILFAGDTILNHITPNAFVMFDRNSETPVRKSQKEYFHSLSRLETLSPVITWPAHGKSIQNLEEVLQGYQISYEQRQTRILEIIGDKELTIYEISRELFPDIKGAIKLYTEIFFMVSEVYSHLQVLEEDGKVKFNLNGNKVMKFTIH